MKSKCVQGGFRLLRGALVAVIVAALPKAAVAGPLEDSVEADAAYWRGDFATALRLRRSLAENGDAEAQCDLGFMYAYGRGVPQDYAEAVKWYRLAADQGWPLAQSSLGLMYRDGRGVPQDYVSAHMWLNLSAAQGNGPAMQDRDFVAERMTPAQIAEAQKLAREWKPTTRRPQ